jgi:hypothetical protein
MPDAGRGPRHRQLRLVAGSAASVLVVVAAVALLVHPWRDTAARSPAARATGPATSSDTPLASPPTSLSASSFSGPASSAALASSPTAAPVSRRPSPSARVLATDSKVNFKVSVQVSPAQVVVGQPVRVTVTIVNAGGVFDRPVTMFFQGSDPSDNVSDAPPLCTIPGAIVCPITGIQPGRTWSFTFTFIPGPFPAMGHYDDALCGAFDYTDSHGEQQQTPSYCTNVLLFDTPSSSPSPASGAPTNTTTPSPPSPSASAPSTTTTPAPSSAG